MINLMELETKLGTLVDASRSKYTCPMCNLNVQMNYLTDHLEKYCKNKNPELAIKLRQTYPNMRALHLI